ncbi:MAG: polysaccharide deacetylase family protein [Firmicutes bacterium]|nr:polysaccharide deacetylase family protein [Bacillota bacterium]
MKKRSILIGIFLVAAIVAVCFFAVDKTPTLTLKGPEEVELTLGQEFHEDGYTATDYRGNVITAIVKKEMPDLNIVGDQFIKYSVTRNGKTATAYRLVKVRHKAPPVLESYELYESYEAYEEAYYAYQEYLNHDLPILMYHNVYDPANPPENLHSNYISTVDLEAHLQYLKDENYYFPTWQEVRDFIDMKIDLPEKSIVLCFDDASNGFIENGIPLIEKMQVPVTSFVIGITKGERMAEMAKDLQYVSLQSHSYDMHRGGGRIGHGGVFTALSYEDGMADLKQSVKQLGNGDAFAYPFGDYTPLCRQIVEEAGFLAAVTTVNGKAYPGSDPYLLPRVRINLGNDLEQFKDLIK